MALMQVPEPDFRKNPELLLLHSDEQRRVVFKVAYRRVRKRLVVVGCCCGAIVGLLVPFVAGAALGLVSKLAIAALVAGAISAPLLAAYRWGLEAPLQRTVRRELVARGVPVCLACGYSLIGSVSGVCPECGAAAKGAGGERS